MSQSVVVTQCHVRRSESVSQSVRMSCVTSVIVVTTTPGIDPDWFPPQILYQFDRYDQGIGTPTARTQVHRTVSTGSLTGTGTVDYASRSITCCAQPHASLASDSIF